MSPPWTPSTEPPDEILIRFEQILLPMVRRTRDNQLTAEWWSVFQRECLHTVPLTSFEDELERSIIEGLDFNFDSSVKDYGGTFIRDYAPVMLLAWRVYRTRMKTIAADCEENVAAIESLVERIRTDERRVKDAKMALGQVRRIRFELAALQPPTRKGRRKHGQRDPADRTANVQVPELDKTNGQWVKSIEAARIEKVHTRTLANYRAIGPSRDDPLSGVDGDGRMWRRESATSHFTFYLRSSLTKIRTKNPGANSS